jgi:hypothetical protein
MACAEDGVQQALLPEKMVEEDFVSRKWRRKTKKRRRRKGSGSKTPIRLS